jgi:hypothetical protein
MTKNKPIEKIIEDIRNDPEARKQARALIGKNKPLSESKMSLEEINNDNLLFIKAYGKRENPYLFFSKDVKTALECLKCRGT